jgi:hypothetical protein
MPFDGAHPVDENRLRIEELIESKVSQSASMVAPLFTRLAYEFAQLNTD